MCTMMNLYYGTICILVLSTVTSASTDKDGSDKRGGELRSTDSCTETKRLLQDKGFTQAVPDFAISGDHLRVCNMQYTCCTTEMELRLSTQSVVDFQNKVSEKSSSVDNDFEEKFRKFDVFFKEIIENSKTSLHELFNKTYGTLYEENSVIFMNLFDSLKLYYSGTLIDIDEIFDGFFTTIMQQVYKLLNPSFDISEDYMQCIADNINIIQPFKDFPQKLSNQVRRAFIAARTLVRGLETGRQVVKDVSKIYPTTECAKALMKMSYCSNCHGYNVAKPCHNLCLNVMKGCLSNLGDINGIWNKYIEYMTLLLDRLEGPFNIESVLDPIDVKISEAIMTLQDNWDDIAETVFNECGDMAKKSSSVPLDFSHFNFNGGFSNSNGQNNGLMKDPAGSNLPKQSVPVPLDLSQYNFNINFNSNGDDDEDEDDDDLMEDLTGISNIDFSSLLEDLPTTDDNLPGHSSISKRSIDEEMDGDVAMESKNKKKKNKRDRKRKRRARKRRGRYSLKKRTKPSYFGRRDRRKSSTSSKAVPKSGLSSLIIDMRKMVSETKNFWKNLTTQVCKNESEQDENTDCWNGITMGKYNSLVVGDGLQNQASNPEVKVNVTKPPGILIRQQIAILQEITSKLKHAYQGIEPALVDEETTTIYDHPVDAEASAEGSAEEETFNKETTEIAFGNIGDGEQTVEDLESWQIKLVEQVLGRPITPGTKLVDLQKELAQQPNFGPESKIVGEDDEAIVPPPPIGSTDMPFEIPNKEDYTIGDLEPEQIKLVEQLLGEKLPLDTKLVEIQGRLAQHPLLGKDTIPNLPALPDFSNLEDHTIAELTSEQVQALELALGESFPPETKLSYIKEKLMKNQFILSDNFEPNLKFKDLNNTITKLMDIHTGLPTYPDLKEILVSLKRADEDESLTLEDLTLDQVKTMERLLGPIKQGTKLTEVRKRFNKMMRMGEKQDGHEDKDRGKKHRRKDKGSRSHKKNRNKKTREEILFKDLPKIRQREIEETLGVTVSPETKMEEVRSMLKELNKKVETTTAPGGGASGLSSTFPLTLSLLVCAFRINFRNYL